MTPVLLLSDGYLGNGSEPWPVPDADALPPITVRHATLKTAPHSDGGQFLPYVRDEATLARPWALPGTAGLEHRIGGIEKDSKTGGVSYDPANHQLMTDLRAAKVARVAQSVAPVEVEGDPDGDVLVVGWGSTYGAITSAVRRVRGRGVRAGHVHLRWLNPLPRGLAEALRGYRRVLVPELNAGQLVRILRAEFLVDAESLSKVQGLPFKAREIEEAILSMATHPSRPDHA
jgi:2-oxoglutarate ferredoxin oxidoreductase subunit alpha